MLRGLVHIDDRDIITQYVNVVPKNHQEELLRLKGELKTSRINHLGNGVFKIDLPVIVCTGSGVYTLFSIPYMHELLKLEVKHVNDVGADSSSSLDYVLSRRLHNNLLFDLFGVEDVIRADIYDEFTGFHHERGQYSLYTKSSNTDRIHVTCYIRLTGD